MATNKPFRKSFDGKTTAEKVSLETHVLGQTEEELVRELCAKRAEQQTRNYEARHNGFRSKASRNKYKRQAFKQALERESPQE